MPIGIKSVTSLENWGYATEVKTTTGPASKLYGYQWFWKQRYSTQLEPGKHYIMTAAPRHKGLVAKDELKKSESSGTLLPVIVLRDGPNILGPKEGFGAVLESASAAPVAVWPPRENDPTDLHEVYFGEYFDAAPPYILPPVSTP